MHARFAHYGTCDVHCSRSQVSSWIWDFACSAVSWSRPSRATITGEAWHEFRPVVERCRFLWWCDSLVNSPTLRSRLQRGFSSDVVSMETLLLMFRDLCSLSWIPDGPTPMEVGARQKKGKDKSKEQSHNGTESGKGNQRQDITSSKFWLFLRSFRHQLPCHPKLAHVTRTPQCRNCEHHPVLLTTGWTLWTRRGYWPLHLHEGAPETLRCIPSVFCALPRLHSSLSRMTHCVVWALSLRREPMIQFSPRSSTCVTLSLT